MVDIYNTEEEEKIITVTNPLGFMNQNFMTSKLNALGYEDSYKMRIITKNQMPWEIEIQFCMKELADKFFIKQNQKKFVTSVNYFLELHRGPSDKKSIIFPETKEIIFPENYSKWVDTNYEKRKNEKGLVLIRKPEIENQKRVMAWLLKKIGKSVLNGQSIMNLSLPVYVFDKRSMLQIFAYELQESSFSLSRVFHTQDIIEKLKFMTVFFLSQIYHSTLLIKPFSPILGETYQIKIGNLNCYLEQTLHKPPTANIYCFDDEKLYKIYGFIVTIAQTGANSCKAKKISKLFIEFKDGQKYRICYPDIIFDGTIMGTRTFNYDHSALVIDINNNLCSFIKFNLEKKSILKGFFGKKKTDIFPDKFIGKIVDLSEIKIDEKGGKHEINKNARSYSEISGEWTKELKFDDNVYWTRDLGNLLKFYEPEYKLKSDCVYREDMKSWIETNDENLAQIKKEECEELQRRDAELRAKYMRK